MSRKRRQKRRPKDKTWKHRRRKKRKGNQRGWREREKGKASDRTRSIIKCLGCQGHFFILLPGMTCDSWDN